MTRNIEETTVLSSCIDQVVKNTKSEKQISKETPLIKT